MIIKHLFDYKTLGIKQYQKFLSIEYFHALPYELSKTGCYNLLLLLFRFYVNYCLFNTKSNRFFLNLNVTYNIGLL